jgi:cobaltochelatase CobT
LNAFDGQVRNEHEMVQLCAAVVRACSGDYDLNFRGCRWHKGDQALPFYPAHLYPLWETDDFVSFRGAADGISLRLTASNAALHLRLMPEGAVENALFDLLEQFRVEALAPAEMPGMIQNLRHCHERWSLRVHHSGVTETARGILLYTVIQICRARVTGQQVVEETEDLLEVTRATLSPLIGRDLACLRRRRNDQEGYAEHARSIARKVATMLEPAEGPVEGKLEHNEREDSVHAILLRMIGNEGHEAAEKTSAGLSGRGVAADESQPGYRVFTTAYDQECKVSSLVRGEVLADHRKQLDFRIARQGVNVTLLARELQQLLATPAQVGWDIDQEEGRVDGRRLAQLVATPAEARVFRMERAEPGIDCAVTFLVDCSGSMKENSESVAMLVDVFARALELAGASAAILGFTTRAWNGGRAIRDWAQAGKPGSPGRLNERLHLVFKDPDETYRKSRPDIAALLKNDLFREGFDGEGLHWACEKLVRRAERQKIILVISDGSPMDTATHLHNGGGYLDRHLRDVVRTWEHTANLHVLGLCVAQAPSPYYRQSHILELPPATGNRVFRDIVTLIGTKLRC